MPMSPVGSKTRPFKSTFEFPLSVYDRPSIALANLATGNLDATTRAIFSPMTLTPDEMKSIRQKFLADDLQDDPIIKTAVDLATNPIVILGLIMMLGTRGKIGTPAELAKLWSAGGSAMKQIHPFMRALSSPFTAMRSIWHLPVRTAEPIRRLGTKPIGTLDALIEMGRRTRWFGKTGMHAYERSEKVFQAAAGRPIDRTDRMLTYLWQSGMHHLPKFSGTGAQKEILRAPLQSYYVKLFGDKAPLMPELERVMRERSPHLLAHANRVQSAYRKWGKVILQDQSGKVHNQMLTKGVRYLWEDYAPMITTRSNLERFLSGSPTFTAKAYRGIMRRIGEVGVLGPHARARIGNAVPMRSEIDFVRNEVMKSQGRDIFGPGMYDKFLQTTSTQIEQVKQLFLGLAQGLKKSGVGTNWTITEAGEIIGADKKAPELALRTLRDAYQMLSKQFMLRQGQKGISEAAATLTRELQTAATMAPQAMDDFVGALARGVGAPAEYIIDSGMVTRHYLRAMAPTYAWWRGGLGDALTKTVTTSHVSDSPWLRRMFTDDLGPTLMGLKSFKGYARSQLFRDTAHSFKEWLASDSKAVQLIPTATRQRLMEVFSGGRGGLSEATLGGRISSLLYTSALGLNMSPISKNLMQTWITTMPILGPKNMALGLQRLAKDLPKLPEAVKKYGKEGAIRKLFPEYHKAFGSEEIIRAMAAGDIAKEGALMGRTASNLLQKGLRGVMTPFGVSEKFNRLLTFYSGLEAGKVSGLSQVAATGFATKLTMFTQFTGGPLGLAGWARGVWPPFRQFGHFPTRFMEYLYGTMRMGPEGGLTTGVLGRGMVGSAGIYTIAKNILKMDISGGLAVHALPGPVYERTSFYPAPYVPPIIGAAGDVLKAIHTGDFSRLPSTGALFVPAGLAAKRMWRTWAPKYADYSARTPEGRIPIYNQNKALISTQSPVELAMRGFGLHPTGPAAERQMMQYLLTQREKIRQYRREYLEALGENNLEKAQQVNQEFQKKYPELGPLQIKKSDIRAVQNRKETTRLRRAIKGFPKEYKPLFEAMLEQASLAQLSEAIDYNPESLQYYLE